MSAYQISLTTSLANGCYLEALDPGIPTHAFNQRLVELLRLMQGDKILLNLIEIFRAASKIRKKNLNLFFVVYSVLEKRFL